MVFKSLRRSYSSDDISLFSVTKSDVAIKRWEQATIQDIRSASEKIAAELTEKETASYNKLLDRKFLDQFTAVN
jgi:hypothetical protein